MHPLFLILNDVIGQFISSELLKTLEIAKSFVSYYVELYIWVMGSIEELTLDKAFEQFTSSLNSTFGTVTEPTTVETSKHNWYVYGFVTLTSLA